MPITPFHFGPGGALHALAPRHISFLSFCASNVLIDVEPLYYMLTDQYPLHRFLHTYVGSMLIIPVTAIAFMLVRQFDKRWRLPDVGRWHDLSWPQIWMGAAAGTTSHVFLDSIMHADMQPLQPFSASNPTLQIINVGTLHLLCVTAGVAALGLLGLRWMLMRRRH